MVSLGKDGKCSMGLSIFNRPSCGVKADLKELSIGLWIFNCPNCGVKADRGELLLR